jgi:hypothetical protein
LLPTDSPAPLNVSIESDQGSPLINSESPSEVGSPVSVNHTSSLNVQPTQTTARQTETALRKDLQTVKDEIAAILKTKLENDSKQDVADCDYALIKRAVSHVCEEDIEVLAWVTPPSKPKTEAGQAHDTAAESKEFKGNVILHYKHPLYNSMMSTVKLAGTYGYRTDQFFHRRDTVVKSKKPSRAIDGTRPILPPNQTIFDNAKVIIPICIGFQGALTGKDLADVVGFYRNNKVAEIIVYFGEYNKLDDPADQLDAIGDAKRQAWLDTNNDILKQYAVKTLSRAELLESPAHRAAKAFVETRYASTELKYNSVSIDAQAYIDGKIKPGSPRLTGQSEGSDGIDSFSLEDGEQSDSVRGFDPQHVHAVAKALFESTEGNKNKADVAIDFLKKLSTYNRFATTQRASKASDPKVQSQGRSLYSTGNTMFSSSTAPSVPRRPSRDPNVVNGTEGKSQATSRMTMNGKREE